MKLKRTASRAKNSIENEITLSFSDLTIGFDKKYDLKFESHDVAEFGSSKTHYDYNVSLTLEELLLLIDAASKVPDEGKDRVREVFQSHLGKLHKIINICAE